MRNPPGDMDNEEYKRRRIQQRTVLVLHANKCKEENCNLPFCGMYKSIINHMSKCHRKQHCRVAHCASTKQILSHWKNCKHNECLTCRPLRNVILGPEEVRRKVDEEVKSKVRNVDLSKLYASNSEEGSETNAAEGDPLVAGPSGVAQGHPF